MEMNTICQIVAWIKARCEDWEDYEGETFSRDDTAAEIYLKFLTQPKLIYEYPDEFGTRVPNGCTYVYRKGMNMRGTCGEATLPEKSRCRHHDHVIFSDRVRAYIEQYHAEINQEYRKLEATRGREDEESSEDEERPVYEESRSDQPPRPKVVVNLVAPGLYREVEKGLLIKMGSAPNEFICVGYSPLSHPVTELPLTPELQVYCRSLGIKMM